jgi:vacuolar-type H+-ATPase subunit D/Vma8
MLAKLKEYKELIAIILFFASGFVWLEKEYPKKAELKSEIAVLNCMLEKYMTLTQYQIRSQELEKQIQQLNNEIKNFPQGTNGAASALSPAMKSEMDEIAASLSDKKNELKENKNSMNKIIDELARNVCGKEK